MSIFNLSWKFFTRRAESNKINITSFLPMVGIALGIVTIILTFAIMDGLESDIFGTLKNFSGGTIINTNGVSHKDIRKIKSFLDENKVLYSDFIDRKAIIQFGKENRIVNVRAFSNLDIPLNGILNRNIENHSENSIIIGFELANRLNIYPQDSIKIISPLDLKFSSSFIPQEYLIVNDIFTTRLLDFDLNFVYVPYIIGENLFKKSGDVGIYLKNEFPLPLNILNIKNIKIKNWDDVHSSLVSAMRLEKIAYVGFGFLLIIISGFSLLSTMSISVMQKISQIGILKAMGYTDKIIKMIFFYFSTLSGVIGVFIGISIALLIKLIETHYPFFHFIFGNYPFLNFPIEIDSIKIFWISLCSIITIILASILPANKAASLNPVHSIGMK
jgi:lipoprotein-releasing system permease protein